MLIIRVREWGTLSGNGSFCFGFHCCCCCCFLLSLSLTLNLWYIVRSSEWVEAIHCVGWSTRRTRQADRQTDLVCVCVCVCVCFKSHPFRITPTTTTKFSCLYHNSNPLSIFLFSSLFFYLQWFHKPPSTRHIHPLSLFATESLYSNSPPAPSTAAQLWQQCLKWQSVWRHSLGPNTRSEQRSVSSKLFFFILNFYQSSLIFFGFILNCFSDFWTSQLFAFIAIQSTAWKVKFKSKLAFNHFSNFDFYPFFFLPQTETHNKANSWVARHLD